MDNSPNLQLPYILAAQAQKHVTHNEAVRALDALVHLSVLDRSLATPPATPADGDRYLVAAGATGAWSGASGRIAAYQDGAWAFLTPKEGFIAWIADENVLLAFDGATWQSALGSGADITADTLGINATADTTNRLSLASPATLFNHEGAGHQLKINKATAADTASILVQTGFTGRAEIGTVGDDHLQVKVSADGMTWLTALLVDKTSGQVWLPYTATGVTSLLLNGID
ncbi:MAG TPA: DUF2793 domain-containing protein, partial [Hyphomicrobiaceae bacterium]|nr:DUF2793 domain-containing protein [Hyphomicrobiaceae bacterium]